MNIFYNNNFTIAQQFVLYSRIDWGLQVNENQQTKKAVRCLDGKKANVKKKDSPARFYSSGASAAGVSYSFFFGFFLSGMSPNSATIDAAIVFGSREVFPLPIPDAFIETNP